MADEALNTMLTAEQRRAMRHGMNCPAGTPGYETDCKCGLHWRDLLQTEREMHAAWRKRATEAEERENDALSELARLRGERDSLSAFAAKIFDGWPDDYTEMDGFDAQTIGLEYGLLARQIMPAPCGEGESCSCASNGADFPTECYRFTSLLQPLPSPPVQSHEEKQG